VQRLIRTAVHPVRLWARRGAKERRRNGREFGLAFASAHLAHLGLVGWLCAIGAAPAGVFVLFGIAAFSLYLLAVLSVPAARLRLLRLVTMTHIAYAFAADFLTHKQVAGIRDTLAYLPFSALVIAGFLLRLAAFAAQTRAGSARCQTTERFSA
jgi:hypothetical protein